MAACLMRAIHPQMELVGDSMGKCDHNYTAVHETGFMLVLASFRLTDFVISVPCFWVQM